MPRQRLCCRSAGGTGSTKIRKSRGALFVAIVKRACTDRAFGRRWLIVRENRRGDRLTHPQAPRLEA